MNNNQFWLKQSNLLDWYKNPSFSFKKKKNNFTEWYSDGKINAYYNCVTKNIESGLGNKVAIHTINKERKFSKYTYNELNNKVNYFCEILKSKLKKQKLSDCKILIYSAASIESAVAMLSCAKLGIHFAVLFEDLASEAVKKRIDLLKPNIFISRVNRIPFYKKISISRNKTKKIKFIFFEDIKFSNKYNENYNKNSYFKGNKDFFTLFTSGSTGIPKGVVTGLAGYLVYTKFTCKHQFGMNKNSIVLVGAEAGNMNGHTYALFGPLLFGASTVLIESPMLLIDEILLKKILKLKVTILHLPVTLIRLMKAVFKNIKFQTKYLVTLGSLGEHLSATVAEWFASHFNNKNKPIINAYYQTENSGIMCSPKYNQNIKQVPHGSIGRPTTKFIKLNKIYKNKKVEMKICSPWPGCMKRIINGKEVWDKYWDKSNNFRMFDLASIKKNNFYIHGRVDDVINIRGHRIGSEEIESIISKIKKVYECCAVSISDKMSGDVIYLFVASKSNNLNDEISKKIVGNFGAFALPKKIYYISEMPKNKSGKMLRRVLRTILEKPNTKDYGDLSTILNKKVLFEVQQKVLKNG
jgi:acyl-coenzyme A synthetase/AMP-(fatty) acid ligase